MTTIQDFIQRSNEYQKKKRYSKKKLESSNFYITINSQSTDLKQQELLKSAFQTFYDNLEEFLLFRREGSGPQDVERVVCREVSVEVGSKFKRVHLHALVSIVHRTNLQLNLKKMKSFFESVLGRDSIHLDCQHVDDPLDLGLQYIKKQELREFVSRK